MAINTNDGFHVQSKVYIDDRQGFDTLENMKNYNENLIPDGFETYVKATDKKYKYLSTNTIDVDLGRWREVEINPNEEDNISLWLTDTNYLIGNKVIYDYKIYECITDHTSTVFADDITNWEFKQFVDVNVYSVSKEEYKKLIEDGVITDSNRELYIVKDAENQEEVNIDYENVNNKPSINNVTLEGNKISSDLGLVGIEEGKGLSTNDFTNLYKNKLDTLENYVLGQIGKTKSITYKIVSGLSDMTDSTIIYLLLNNSTNKYDMYVKEETKTDPTIIGNMDVNLDDYYTSTEIENTFLKITDVEDKYVNKSSDIADNLTTDDATKVLSARQGMLLKAMMPVGVVLPYVSNIIPSGYLLCNGQAVSRTTYAELFNIIGTTYGSGDGSTTFNLPNLQNKFIEGAGTNAVGTEMSAGLPDITGELTTWQSGGAFSNVLLATKSGFAPGDLWDDCIKGITSFKASRSNSIYGKSNTVQPPAICMNYIIKAE